MPADRQTEQFQFPGGIRGVAAAAAARRGAGSLLWSSTAAFDSATSQGLTDVQTVAISNIQTSIFRGGR